MKLIDIIHNRDLTKYLILGFSTLVLVLILQKFFLLVVLIGVSLVISYFTGTYQSKTIGIELVTFTTVLAGFAFGPTTGALIGLILITTHLTIGHFAFGPYIFWTIPFYVAVGILSGTLTGVEFTTLGIYTIIAINALSLVLTAITFPQNLGVYIPFAVTNILFNVIIFSQFGPLIYSLVK